VRTYQNPFRARASEHQRDLGTFLRNFGDGVLDLLPESIWDRPLVLRSAPGGGKTSLLRLFTIESLSTIHERRESFETLVDRLTRLGALTASGPAVFGVMLNLDRDYRALRDVVGAGDASLKVFFRLLDARITMALVRGALLASNVDPRRLDLVEIRVRDNLLRASELLERFGGARGDAVFTWAGQTEREVLDQLDSLLPVDFNGGPRGHSDLYSLRLFSDAEIVVSGRPLGIRPLLLFDNGHDLTRSQRDALLERLFLRDLDLSRWYAERFEALSTGEVMAPGSIEGRDHELLELESAARRGRKGVNFDKVLKQVAELRAQRALERYADVDYSFTELLEYEQDRVIGPRTRDVARAVRERVEALAGHDDRYREWIRKVAQTSEESPEYSAGVAWRELEILIARDEARPIRELFPMPLAPEDAERASGSGVREAAALFFAREHGLPYYAGPDTVAKLGFNNIEQFLTLSGDLFQEMLAELILNRSPRMTPERQHSVIRRASDNLWRTIPRRLPYGQDVQRLLLNIVAVARQDTYRPTAPYAPGVTGSALLMYERDQLLESAFREHLPGGERLYRALGSAIAYNMVTAELNRTVKNQLFMVIYLNRLLLPRFDLPLGYGGFRERRLGVMAGWLTDVSRQASPEIEELSLELRL
jgi:hypothetical protein